MNHTLKTSARILTPLLGLATLLLLPIIPVIQSPVTPHPMRRHTMVSLMQLVASFGMVGVRIQPTAMAIPVLVGVLIVAGIIIRRFLR